MRVAAALRRLLERRGVGQLPGLARFAPQPNHRALRHVEGALGRCRQPQRPLQDRKQIGTHRDRGAHRLARHPIQFAVGHVVRQDGVQLANPREPRRERHPRRGRVGRVHRDGHQRAHVGLDPLEALERRGVTDRSASGPSHLTGEGRVLCEEGRLAEASDHQQHHEHHPRDPAPHLHGMSRPSHPTSAFPVPGFRFPAPGSRLPRRPAVPYSPNTRVALSCSSLRSIALLATRRRTAAIVCAPWHVSPLPT